MTESERYLAYLQQLRRPFQKLSRLRFLNPDGSTGFALDNNPHSTLSRAFIADGNISVNLQNGARRSVKVTLDNINDDFDYSVNRLWFGQEIALDEGLVLPDGSDYYIQQGVFLPSEPTEDVRPGNRTMQYNLVDKWANLDGSLFGRLDGTYVVSAGTNIFAPIAALLAEDRGNGLPVDRMTPVFTEYYNGMTQALPDGGQAPMTSAPYTLTVDAGGCLSDVVLGLSAMLNAWTGYDATGALRLDPSQDDIADATKAVLWQFSQSEAQLLGMAYTVKNTAVFNDYIVVGEQLDGYAQPKGRAQNLDPASDTNVYQIGRKTTWEHAAGYATDKQCKDLAAWKLKRSSILQKTVSISCVQMFHIQENSLVELVRTDKPGAPVERHLIQGFTRPLVGPGNMTIQAVSTVDLPQATII